MPTVYLGLSKELDKKIETLTKSLGISKNEMIRLMLKLGLEEMASKKNKENKLNLSSL